MASGSIQKRTGKRGVRWTVVYDDPTTVGKRKQRRKTFRTREEAKAFHAKTLHQINTGEFIRPTITTVEEFLTHWLETYVKHNVRPTTYRSYEQMIRLHIVPMLGGIELQKLQPSHLQAFYSSKLEGGRADGKKGGLSPRTVQYLHRIIREALQHAMKWGEVARNVADATDPPTPQRKPPRVWSHEEVSAFLIYVEGTEDRFRVLWHLALTTGMRRGELLGLRWEDIDFEKRVLRIRQNLVEVNGQIRIQEPKTKSGRRSVALLPATIERLRAYRTSQLEKRLRAGEAWQDNDLVFSTEIGDPLYPAHVARHFRQVNKASGLPRITFHGLRHTHATLLLRDGVHLKIASERLGHSSIALTADTYSHVLPDMQRQALEQIDASIFDVRSVSAG